MANNQFSGTIPSFSELPSLQKLVLTYNQFSGVIPSFNGLPNLQTLDLGSNQFSGAIPSFSELPNLQNLYLNDNQFIGNVPDLPASIQRFFVSDNLLNGIIPDSLARTVIPIPFDGFDSLGLCGSTNNTLTPVDANVNSFIAAHIRGWAGYCGSPATTTHFSVTGFPSSSAVGKAGTITVTALDASNKTVLTYTGTVAITSSDSSAGLPVSATLTNGVGMFSITLNTVGSQTITAADTIVTSVTGAQTGITVNKAASTDCSKVTQVPTTECDVLVALFNSTNGSGWSHKDGWNVDNSICTWTGITCAGGHVISLILINSNLSGSLPSFSGLTSLQILDLPTNNLSGSLPSFSGLTNLQRLDLFGNHLSGSLPSFNGLTSLQVLDLDDNHLNGSLPSFSGLTSLQVLVLFSNQFTGNVPDLPTSLQQFYVSNNLLNGTIPDSLTTTAISSGNLDLCGTSNILTPVDMSVNSFIKARITGWAGYCGPPVTHFSVTGFPSPSTVGTAGSITVTALDGSNQIQTNYDRTVSITSSDPNVVPPVSATLTNGVGMFNVTLKTVGTWTITATDTVVASITGVQTGIVINKAVTTTTFTSNANPSMFSQSVTFTASVAPANATGTVTFTVDGTLGTPATLTSGTAAFAISTLTLGTHMISVSYSGDANNTTNTSAMLTQTVIAATFTPTVSVNPTATPTTIPSNKPDTIGVFRPNTATFYLRGSNTQGFANLTVHYGSTNSYPVVGDWTGAGVTTIGVFDPTNGQFQLRNSNTSGVADETFVLGIAGDQPFAGHWRAGAAHDGVGVFRPSNGLIYLKNELNSGFADYTMVLGIPGDIGVAGDWDGNGINSPGVFRPNIVTFYLSDQVVNGSVFGDHTVTLGYAGDMPFVGDWSGQGHAGVGVFRPTNGLIYLKNDLSTGFADVNIVYGIPNDIPVAGHWGISGPAPHNSLIVPNTPLPVTATVTPTHPSIRLTQPNSYDG